MIPRARARAPDIVIVHIYTTCARVRSLSLTHYLCTMTHILVTTPILESQCPSICKYTRALTFVHILRHSLWRTWQVDSASRRKTAANRELERETARTETDTMTERETGRTETDTIAERETARTETDTMTERETRRTETDAIAGAGIDRDVPPAGARPDKLKISSVVTFIQ